MKVNVPVLNWIQMEKPEVWWHLVPVAPYAAGPALCLLSVFYCIWYESLSMEMDVGR